MKSRLLLEELQLECERNVGQDALTELHDRKQVSEKCADILRNLCSVARTWHTNPIPDTAVGSLISWDLTAFVTTTSARDAFAILLSTGAARFVDVSNA